MRIKLIKLHSSPEIFNPIEFYNGINLIVGEKVEEDNIKKGKKTNGVGKSLCVEFINFCLLKKSSDSRVVKIPLDKFSEDTQIILDLEINGQNLRIIRTKEKPDNPVMIINDKETEFANLEDANQELKKILFSEFNEEVGLSFREFLGPFIREEDSEFKEIIECYDLKKKIPKPNLVKPHAFIFGIDISIISEIQKGFKEIDRINTHKNELKKSLTENGTKKISDVKAELNSLNDDLIKIDSALESLKTNEVYEAEQEELEKLQIQIEEIQSRKSALRYQLKKIKSFPELDTIRKGDIEIVYNQFKAGLGNVVVKSIKEVENFKQKIDEFQKKLFHEKMSSLNEELKIATEQLQLLEDKKAKKLQIIDQKGVLKDVKNGYEIYHQKKDSFASIQHKYDDFQKTEREWNNLKSKKDQLFVSLDSLIFEAQDKIESFNKTILIIHEYIMDSTKASFDIKILNKGANKQILSFEMRIDDDGSHSIDRVKVFIYDLALLFNEFIQKRHPHFLLHDNIFDVDQDTLIKSLNYLAQKENPDFQYILTLNRDKVENEEQRKELELDIENHKIANFTKNDRFLYGDSYAEI